MNFHITPQEEQSRDFAIIFRRINTKRNGIQWKPIAYFQRNACGCRRKRVIRLKWLFHDFYVKWKVKQ